jgi:xyloglucan-specific exo-beta-1,4-glucanase
MLRINVVFALLLMAVVKTTAQNYFNWNAVNIQGMGYVTGLVIHPNSIAAPNLVYVRTDVGGSFRYNSSDNSWVQLGDYNSMASIKNQDVESIA